MTNPMLGKARRVVRPGGLVAEVFGGLNWSIPLVGLLLYVTEITTYWVNIATASIVMALLGVLLQRERIRAPAMLLWFGLFLAWAWVGRSGTAYPAEVSESLIEAFKLWLILFVVLNTLRSPKQVYLYLYVVVGAYLLYPARGAVFNLFLYNGAPGGRTAWIRMFSNPNDHASITLLALSLAATILVGARHKIIRNSAFVGVVTLVLVILMTQSRGAFLALVSFGLLSFSARRWQRRLMVFLFIGALAFTVVPSGVWTRVSGLSQATDVSQLRGVDEEGSAAQRYDIWQTAFRVIAEEPIVGVGLGAAAEVVGVYSQKLGARDVHSTFFTILVETGFVGLALFLAFILSTMVFADRIRRRAVDWLPRRSQELRFLEIGLISYLIAGVFGTYGLLPFLYLQAGLLWALAKICEDELAYVERMRRVRR